MNPVALGKARAKQYSLLKALEKGGKGGVGVEGCTLGDKVRYDVCLNKQYEATSARKGDVCTTPWGCKLHGSGCDHGDARFKYVLFGLQYRMI